MSESQGTWLSIVSRRVAMADVDGAQIIYFTSPLRWMEAQFTEWLARIGHPLSELLRGGLGMPVVSAEASFKRPLRLDDIVEQRLFAGDIGRTSFTIGCHVHADPDDAPVVTLRAVHVWSQRANPGVDRFVPTAIPTWLRSALTT